MFSCKVPTPTNLVGVGLRSPHISHLLANSKKISKKIGWLEVHSENYYNLQSHAVADLVTLRKTFPISLHSVGNSLGSAQKLDLSHLQKLKNLVEKIEPFLISDHISWGRIDENHLNDLLPLPYTKNALQAISTNVSIMQDFLKRPILVENPSAYLAFKNQEMDEAEFINELTKKTGCGLLLDVNNIFVSSQNCDQFDPTSYIKKINKKIVGEIHLAGHSKSQISNREILIDTHNDVVCDEVWEIYKMVVKHCEKVPSLIEWDQDFPEFDVLLDEAKKAGEILKK
jgi:uncharacterized protein (UPF0276 family)